MTAKERRLIPAGGLRRWLFAGGAGALSALAMAPFDAWPVLFLTFPALVFLVDDDALRRRGVGFSTGWWFGFGYFVAGLYWIGYAFLVDARTFGWLLPFAVVGLPAVLAVYTGLGTALARLLWTRGPTRILALGAALTVSEWLRGHLLTGFPWNAFGYALTAPLALAQGASVIGIWGLTFMAVVVFASPACLADERTQARWLPLAASVAALGILAGFGALRLADNPTRLVDNVHLRIMQPDLPQDAKFNYAARKEVMDRYVALSGEPGIHGVTHLLWPESAFPFFLTREADAMARIAKLLSPKTVLITGAMRLGEPVDRVHPAVFNSIYAIGPDGAVLGFYDKVHLVPFGEYLPFERVLDALGLQDLTEMQGGFRAGDRRRLLAIPGAPPALPLICYEIIFGGDAAPPGPRAGWIVNVTNDGWFGISTGPYQHFQQARVRAIEEGLPLARAANTGISAVVDPLGRVVRSLPLGRAGILDAPLPRPAAEPVYARVGDLPAFVAVGLAVVVVLRRRLCSDARRRGGAASQP